MIMGLQNEVHEQQQSNKVCTAYTASERERAAHSLVSCPEGEAELPQSICPHASESSDVAGPLKLETAHLARLICLFVGSYL